MNILVNRIKTPDGTILTSHERHDYKTYVDANGLEYMVDGGMDYLRRNVHKEFPYEELSVYGTDEHYYIRKIFEWGTFGPEGKDPSKRILLENMDESHIKAVLDTQHQIPKYVKEMFENELRWRNGDE